MNQVSKDGLMSIVEDILNQSEKVNLLARQLYRTEREYNHEIAKIRALLRDLHRVVKSWPIQGNSGKISKPGNQLKRLQELAYQQQELINTLSQELDTARLTIRQLKIDLM